MIVFRPLGEEQLKSIIELELAKVTARLIDRGLHLELSDEAKQFLIEKGTSADFGARPLRRAIEQFVEDPLSEDILRGNYDGKGKIDITRAKDDEDKPLDHLNFHASDKPADEVQEEEAAAVGAADAT